MMKHATYIFTAIVVLATGIHTRAAAQEPEPTGVIAGVVFDDANHNSLLDDEETGLADVQLEFSGAGVQFFTATDEHGLFFADVPLAEWEVSLQLPPGYVVANDRTRSVSLHEGVAQAQIEFALWALEDTQAPATPGPEDEEQQADDQGAPIDQVDEGIDAADFNSDDSLPVILPVSGAFLPAAVTVAGLSLTGLVIGAALLVFGRWLARKM